MNQRLTLSDRFGEATARAARVRWAVEQLVTECDDARALSKDLLRELIDQAAELKTALIALVATDYLLAQAQGEELKRTVAACDAELRRLRNQIRRLCDREPPCLDKRVCAALLELKLRPSP